MVVEVKQLTKRFSGERKNVINGIDFQIAKGETLGIFGESGSGKSTIGQMIAGIRRPTSGEIFFLHEYLKYPYKGQQRQGIQILFQHPEVSFNPRKQLAESMKEPYKFYNLPYTEERLLEYLYDFGIYQEHLCRYPGELSGGELQRLALARVLLASPKLIVLDEPTSMLDVVSQAQMIALLKNMQQKTGVAYLFISHDRLLCEQFCTRILYLRNGKLHTIHK